MPTLSKKHSVRITLLFIVFIFFLSNAIGLVEINTRHGPYLSINSLLFAHEAGYGLIMPPVFSAIEFIILLITGIILSIALPLLNPVPASVLAFIATIPPVYFDYSHPVRNSLLPMEFSLLTILMLYVINVLISYFMETHSKQQLMNILGQYVPPQLANELSRHPESVSLEGESRILTIFFCDLQNFSGVAEQLNPKQLTRLLNEYFTVMTEILFHHGATIDKYIGDSIMAFWGAPVPKPHNEQNSVLASFEMHGAIQKLSAEFIKRGWPGPQMGIGINTGMVSVGNMGSKYRITYTAVGDAVNLAARLEKLTRSYHVPIVISESTKQGLGDILCREIDVVQVRGKHSKTRLYQPLCREDEANETLHGKLKIHNEALQHYYANNGEKAKSLFRELYEMDKEDRYYQAMLEKLNN